MAPQLTATKGFALRSLLPWMARANSSLPTPDSPSISTGIDEFAAFCAVRSTPRHRLAARDDVGESQPALAAVADALQFALQRRGVERVAQADLQPFDAGRLDHEILGAGAHRGDDIVDAAMGGLHDDGEIEAGVADFRQHAHAVEAGHHEVEQQRVDALTLAVRPGQKFDNGIAGVDHDGFIAAFLHHVLNQTTLYGVVVGNQNGKARVDCARGPSLPSMLMGRPSTKPAALRSAASARRRGGVSREGLACDGLDAGGKPAIGIAGRDADGLGAEIEPDQCAARRQQRRNLDKRQDRGGMGVA